MPFPTTATALLAEIERLVPERVPQADDTMETIHRYAGKRELVLQLRLMKDRADQPAASKKVRR